MLLLVFLLSIPLLHYLRNEVKKDMQIKILKENFEQNNMVKFSHEELAAVKWEEEGREFIHNDEMYDVVKIETSNGKSIYYCIKDGKENHYRRYKDFIVSFFTASKDFNTYIMAGKIKTSGHNNSNAIVSNTIVFMGKSRGIKKKQYPFSITYSYRGLYDLFQPPEVFLFFV